MLINNSGRRSKATGPLSIVQSTTTNDSKNSPFQRDPQRLGSIAGGLVLRAVFDGRFFIGLEVAP